MLNFKIPEGLAPLPPLPTPSSVTLFVPREPLYSDYGSCFWS